MCIQTNPVVVYAHGHSLYVKNNIYVVRLLTSLELLKKLNMSLVLPQKINMHIIKKYFLTLKFIIIFK